MIPFERLTLEKKREYDAVLDRAAHRGCTFSFANLYIWGRQCAARVGEDLLLFSLSIELAFFFFFLASRRNKNRPKKLKLKCGKGKKIGLLSNESTLKSDDKVNTVD